MTNTKLRELAIEEIEKALKNADLIDGSTLADGEVADTKKICFWKTRVLRESAIKKPIYVTYSIISGDIVWRADNHVKARECFATIDLWTNQSLEHTKVKKIYSDIETNLIKNGWEVTFETEQYDNDSKVFHLPISIFKSFIGG